MFKDENRHYSLRKLSVGLASILIGISFASSVNGSSVKADTVNGDSNGVQTVVKNSDTAIKGNDAVVKTDAKSAPEGQNQTPEAAKKDSGAITQDIRQKVVKASEAVAKLQNNTVKDNIDAKNAADDSKAAVKDAAESTSKSINLAVKQQNTAVQGSNAAGDKASKVNNSSVVQEDSSAKGDSLTDKNNSLKAKAEATNKAVAVVPHADSNETALNLKGIKIIDPKTLKENKTEAAIKANPEHGVDPVKFAANGGFDPAIWGTMDINAWQLDNNGNIIGYNNNKSYYTDENFHIIIPNSADFAKAGKNYQQISISSDEMKKLVENNNAYFGATRSITLAISLTDNKKVKATNADWSSVFAASTLGQANLEGLDTSTITDMGGMFNYNYTLTSLDLSNWNTSNVTNMSGMFGANTNLTSLNLSNWNTSKVTDMSSIFGGDTSLTSLGISKWNTGSVTNMSRMFGDASNLTNLDVSKWNTSNVTNMSFMFSSASSLTNLDVSKWDTSKVTDMGSMFNSASSLTSLDVSKWNTGNVTNMEAMFGGASSLTSLDVSNWKTSNVTDMSYMFSDDENLTNLDMSKWDTGKVTDMNEMFNGASSLTNLDVSKWDTGNVTNMSGMFGGASSLALIVNGDKFADYLVKNNFANSKINSGVKSITTDNAKLLRLLTSDVQHDSSTRTITFTFPANYSPDLAKYHLTKNGNTYQIKQSADYDTSYAQGTVLINETDDITKHHIDTTKKNKLSNTWQPNYNKLVLAHKNSDGSVSFDAIRLPKVPGYKASVKTIPNPVNPARALFAVSFMALPKPITPAINDVKPAKTVTPVTPATEAAELIKTEPKVATTPKAIDLSNNVVTTAPDVSTWQVANDLKHDTYHVSNGKYAVELPHISNAQLHVIANSSTKDSILFTYRRQHTKYVFNIKFVDDVP